MSMMANHEFLDPRTLADIESQMTAGQGDCGCEKRPGRWSICDYHEGYDAALEAHAGYPSVTHEEES
jgi:hypothetical protein